MTARQWWLSLTNILPPWPFPSPETGGQRLPTLPNQLVIFLRIELGSIPVEVPHPLLGVKLLVGLHGRLGALELNPKNLLMTKKTSL
ncbi:hypothetical protein PoB_001895600 [Plakobranchus ocellatus]|uniref:Uncharacterized protein n=1 Tax=Plakobranchus ocellatus TaxID=259542 RepID=A0AAV3YZE5_9GAST|nr:hypothetical protein PoB_001895600 [Plakobranchus ocellatus]